MNRFATTLLTALLLYTGVTSALSTPPATTTQPINQQAAAIIISRRHAAASIFSISGAAATSFFTTPVPNANAAEDNQVLTDEEMAARIARKMELLRASKSGGGSGGGPTGRATDIRSDINPEAAVNLRSRSAIENAKIAMEKQKELKTRDNAQKREDLCEMLGRGC
jgi:hypothetical protein